MTERSEMRLPEMQRQYVHLSLAHPRSPQRTSCGQRQAAWPTVEIRKPTQRCARLRGVCQEHISKNPSARRLGSGFGAGPGQNRLDSRIILFTKNQ